MILKLDKNQMFVLMALRRRKHTILAASTEEAWRQGKAYYIDERQNVPTSLKSAFAAGNETAVQGEDVAVDIGDFVQFRLDDGRIVGGRITELWSSPPYMIADALLREDRTKPGFVVTGSGSIGQVGFIDQLVAVNGVYTDDATPITDVVDAVALVYRWTCPVCNLRQESTVDDGVCCRQCASSFDCDVYHRVDLQ